MGTETTEQLRLRIEPLLDEIDLDDGLPESVRATIAFAQLSGASMGDWAKKLLLLEHRDIINSQQCEQLMVAKYTSQ